MTMTDTTPLVSLDDIRRAREVIAGKVHRTPMLTATLLGKRLGIDLYFKAELFQKTGSFKPRGALNRLNRLSTDEKARGVISLSAGNHAAGLAYAAALSGTQATVVMPASAVRAKIEATQGYGAEVVLHIDITGMLARCQEIQQARNLTLVHPFDDPDVIAGQGTVGLEILEDVPAPDYVIVGVGGGGLISGVAAAIKLQSPATKVIGVEPVGAATMYRSLQENRPVTMDKLETIADGLAAPFGGKHTLAHMQRFVDEVALVTDEQIADALALIMERCKLVVEPAAAAGFAALLHGKVIVKPGAKVVCVLSGGNIDRQRLKQIL